MDGAVARVIEPESQADENYNEVGAITARILHILGIYPQVSPSMLQVALSLPPNEWKPVLEDLIASGKIKRDHVMTPTPTGRHQTYTVLSTNRSFG